MIVFDRSIETINKRCRNASRTKTGVSLVLDGFGMLTGLPCGGYSVKLDSMVGIGGYACRYIGPGLMASTFDMQYHSAVLVSEMDLRFYGFTNISLLARVGTSANGGPSGQYGVVRDLTGRSEYPKGMRVTGVAFTQVDHDLGELDELWHGALRNAEAVADIGDVSNWAALDGPIGTAVNQLLAPPPMTFAAEAFLRAKSTELLCHLSEPASPTSAMLDVVSATKAYLSEALAAPLDIEVLARRTGISPRHLTRLFKAQTGMTLREYQRERRLEVASELLARTDTTVQNIADELGFADAPQFCKQFRSRFGQTPVTFRRIGIASRYERNFSEARP